MSSKIDLILNVLSDGKWHWINELQQLTEFDELQVQEMAAFLFEYDFVLVDLENKKVRIKEDFQNFLVQTPAS